MTAFAHTRYRAGLTLLTACVEIGRTARIHQFEHRW